MKKRKLVVLALMLVLLLAAGGFAYRGLAPKVAPEQAAPAAEEKDKEEAPLAPDFTARDADGNEIRLSELRGRPVVLNFWATWGPPCREELPFFDAAHAAHGEEIAFVMIDLTDGSRDTVESVRAFLDETGYAFPVYYDTELDAAAAYSVTSIPLTVLIDAEGHMLAKHLGSLSETALNELLELFNQ